jgi:hypothetical protein
MCTGYERSERSRSFAEPIRMRHIPLLSLATAALFTILFHGTGFGINVPLFEVVLVGLAFRLRRPLWTTELRIVVGGTFFSALLVVLYGSALALWVNGLSLLLAVGFLLAPELRALHHAFWLSVQHVLPAQRAFLRKAGGTTLTALLPKLGRSNVLPLLTVLGTVFLFAIIYQAANAHFEHLLSSVAGSIDRWLAWMEVSQMLTFGLGLMLTNAMLQDTQHPVLLQRMGLAHDVLSRRRTLWRPSSVLGLRYELRTGVLLLALLNVLLLVVNVLDIRHVWFGFSFNGQYLKQFVHEGTWLLIVSIALGASIVLWYFRANQNFHQSNGLLKRLAYVWLAQNAVLAVSVAIRNFWYIHHYALAYKRIGVVFFLIAVIAGLVLIGLKVRHTRSVHFLLRWNTFSAYVILLLMACVDWDVVIARYNFSKQEQAFVHLDFMATLADKALPWLDHEQHALERIHRFNLDLLDSGSLSRSVYMEPETYGDLMAARKGLFLDTYPQRSWREWNLADARAYTLLSTR